MSKSSLWLRASSLWALLVWVVLIKNMVTDDEHELSFRVVHITLAVVSLIFAAGSWNVARAIDRANRSLPS